MPQIDLDGHYADILERALFNAMLTGMSVDGKAFTYANQMATSAKDASNKREEWFECACCPPNVARVLGHIGGYVWSPKTNTDTSATVNVHLYAAASLEYTLDGSHKSFKLTQKTNYPWDSTIDFELENPSGIELDINLRVPAWADDSWKVSGIISISYTTTFRLTCVPRLSPSLFPGPYNEAICISTPPI